MQALLTDIELDIQELKCLMDAFSREPNVALREVLKRNILQMRGRLDTLLLQLDVAVPVPALPPVAILPPVAVVVEDEISYPVAPVADVLPASPILAERIRTAVDLRRSISLNDSFRFSRELFEGDTELMTRVLQQIGEMSSYAAAFSFLSSKVNVEEENETMADLLELLKKYFN